MLKRTAVGLLACVLAQIPAAADAGPGHAQAHAAARTADGHPSLEGVWASNALLILEATSRTPQLVVPEAEAKSLAAAAAASQADALERALDPEAPAMLRATEGFPLVRGERHTRLVVWPADGKLPY